MGSKINTYFEYVSQSENVKINCIFSLFYTSLTHTHTLIVSLILYISGEKRDKLVCGMYHILYPIINLIPKEIKSNTYLNNKRSREKSGISGVLFILFFIPFLFTTTSVHYILFLIFSLFFCVCSSFIYSS